MYVLCLGSVCVYVCYTYVCDMFSLFCVHVCSVDYVECVCECLCVVYQFILYTMYICVYGVIMYIALKLI